MASIATTATITITNVKAVKALAKVGSIINKLLEDGYAPDWEDRLEKALRMLKYAGKRLDVKLNPKRNGS